MAQDEFIFEYYDTTYYVKGYYEPASQGDYWTPSYDEDFVIEEMWEQEFWDEDIEVWTLAEDSGVWNDGWIKDAILEGRYTFCPEKYADMKYKILTD